MFPEREYAEAAERFRRFFSNATACLTKAPVELIPHGRRNRLLRLACQLRSSKGDDYSVELIQKFTISPHTVHGLKAHTLSYSYAVNSSGDPMLRYEWHPALGIAWPHLHVYGNGSSIGGKPFDKLHLPTGRVAVESVVWLLIDGFEVKPLQPVSVCKGLLKRNQALFEKFKSW